VESFWLPNHYPYVLSEGLLCLLPGALTKSLPYCQRQQRASLRIKLEVNAIQGAGPHQFSRLITDITVCTCLSGQATEGKVYICGQQWWQFIVSSRTYLGHHISGTSWEGNTIILEWLCLKSLSKHFYWVGGTHSPHLHLPLGSRLREGFSMLTAYCSTVYHVRWQKVKTIFVSKLG